ncbi:putative sodium/chloride dependent transporter [Ixodes scapularis]
MSWQLCLVGSVLQGLSQFDTRLQSRTPAFVMIFCMFSFQLCLLLVLQVVCLFPVYSFESNLRLGSYNYPIVANLFGWIIAGIGVSMIGVFGFVVYRAHGKGTTDMVVVVREHLVHAHVRRHVPTAATFCCNVDCSAAIVVYSVFTRPKKWSPNFRLTTSYKCQAVAGRDPGGVPAAVACVAGACSAPGRSLAGQSTGASADTSWDAETKATLTFARALRQHYYDQPPGSRHPTAEHSGVCDVFWCRFGQLLMYGRDRTLNTPAGDAFQAA